MTHIHTNSPYISHSASSTHASDWSSTAPQRNSCTKKLISERNHKAVATRFVILNAAGNTSVNVAISLLFHGAERGTSETQLQQSLTLHELGPRVNSGLVGLKPNKRSKPTDSS